MKIYQNSKMVFFFSLWIAGSLSAKTAWDQSLIYDDDTNSTPLASCDNKDKNGLFVITKTAPKGTFLNREGDCILWEIRTNGGIARRVLLENSDGKSIRTNAIEVGPGCAMSADGISNLMTAGVIGEQQKERSLNIISIEDENREDPNVLRGGQINNFSIEEMISLENGTFALVGGRSKDGTYLRIDNQGKIIKEVPFDMGETEKFTGVTQLKSDRMNLAVVGLSIGGSMKESQGNLAENFILIYDSNDILIYEDYFTGILPRIALPKACCLSNGNIIVTFYNKQSEDSAIGLWAHCYTPKLNLLWKKEVFSADKSLFPFDLTSQSSGGFAVAILSPVKGLKLYSFNKNGSKIGFTEYKGMVGTSGFNLIQISNRTIAVFEEGSPGSIKEVTIKAKIVAFE